MQIEILIGTLTFIYVAGHGCRDDDRGVCVFVCVCMCIVIHFSYAFLSGLVTVSIFPH